MLHEIPSPSDFEGFTGVSAPVSPIPSKMSAFPTRRNYEGNCVGYSLGTNPAFKRGEHSANKHLRSDTNEVSDWLSHQFRKQSAKEISEKTGQGQRAAEAVKMGRNGLTMAHLVNICRADPEFRAQFFQFCGGTLEGEPEMIAALSRAINAVVRGGT